MARTSILEVGTEWAKTLQDRWSRFLMSDRLTVTEIADKNPVLTVALLGGLNAARELELRKAEIVFTPASLSTGFIPRIDWKVSVALKCPFRNFCAIGQTEVFNEFAGITSARAKEESRTWTVSLSTPVRR